MTAAMLQARGLGYRIGGRAILKDVTFEIASGEMLAVLGPNGAGKSTLLRLIAGEIAPESGEIEIEGRTRGAWDRGELARRLAVLPQQSNLRLAFSVRQVVELGRLPHRATRRKNRAAALAAMQATGVEALAERRYTELSGGERQRVQMARVLAQLDRPDGAAGCLLLDEPTAALDLEHQFVVLELARRHAQAGGAVLAVLHDLNLAAQFADRMLLLEAGRVAALGTPEAVLEPALLQRVYKVRTCVNRHPINGRPQVIAMPCHGRGHGHGWASGHETEIGNGTGNGNGNDHGNGNGTGIGHGRGLVVENQTHNKGSKADDADSNDIADAGRGDRAGAGHIRF